MRERIALLFAAAAFTLTAPAAFADTARPGDLQPERWGVVMDVPGTRDVRVRHGVVYLRDARDTLALDLYLPPGLKTREPLPAVVFVNGIGDVPGQPKVKDWEIYRSWPRLVAAHGLIGVSMEAKAERIPECLRAVFDFLGTHGAEYGIDGKRLGCYAASANAGPASAYLFGGSAHPSIRAAALFYGRPPELAPRPDLPVLFLYPESDVPGSEEALFGLWRRVIEARAPWELVFASGLPHAFDAVSDEESSRRLVRRAIDFWRAHLEPAPAAAEPPSAAREVVEAMFWRDPQRALNALDPWLATHPDDVHAWTLRGEKLAQLRRPVEAESAYVKALSLGSTEPGIFRGLGQIRMGQGRWNEAHELLERAIAGGVGGSQILGNLALTQLYLGRNAEAVTTYERAIAAGVPPGPATRGIAYYNLACAHARVGSKDRALDALALAVESGFTDRAGAEADPDLAPVRGEPRWKEIVASITPPPAPRQP